MEAVYMPTVLTHVACFEESGARASQQGETPNGTAKLYIFDNKSRAESNKTYMPYEEWMTCSNKEAYWTLSLKDYFVKGTVTAADPMQFSNAHKVIGFQRFDIGSPRVRHWEIDGS